MRMGVHPGQQFRRRLVHRRPKPHPENAIKTKIVGIRHPLFPIERLLLRPHGLHQLSMRALRQLSGRAALRESEDDLHPGRRTVAHQRGGGNHGIAAIVPPAHEHEDAGVYRQSADFPEILLNSPGQSRPRPLHRVPLGCLVLQQPRLPRAGLGATQDRVG
jgi:hypothetical protein